MRKIIVIFSMFYAWIAFSQPEIILSDLDRPIGLEKYGDFLYFTESVEGTILRMDLTIPNATPEIIVSGIDGPFFY